MTAVSHLLRVAFPPGLAQWIWVHLSKALELPSLLHGTAVAVALGLKRVLELWKGQSLVLQEM
jgi:hypothetical protein